MEWIHYAKRLDSYFVANNTRDAVKKRAILLNAVGPGAYPLIKTLCLLVQEDCQQSEEPFQSDTVPDNKI